MQHSLITAKRLMAAAAVAAVTGLSVGCQNQVAQSEADAVKHASSIAIQGSVEQEQAVLRPVRYRMQVHSGSSGALLPANIDTQLAPLLEKFDDWDRVTRIVIVGHTDAEGSERSNMLLSVRRANALAEKLIDYGVPEVALEVDGRGEEAPIASNSSISGKQLNRRVEVLAEGLQALADMPRLGQSN